MDLHLNRYSLAAARLLLGRSPIVGTIHSCYGRIVNIQTPSQRLLTLQGPGLLQSPCAASLAESIEPHMTRLSPGDLVVQGPNGAQATAVRLITDVAQPWDSRLQPLHELSVSTLHDIGATLTEWLFQHESDRGVAPLLTALTTSSSHPLSPLNQRLYQTLSYVMAQSQLTPELFLEMATQLVGLGEGLTPSGDDILVGFLAVLHITEQVTEILGPEVRTACLTQLLPNTADLSAEFLHCAIDGHFSEPMLRLMQALYTSNQNDWIDHAARLAHVGHSSGVDAMVGIVLGNFLLALAK